MANTNQKINPSTLFQTDGFTQAVSSSKTKIVFVSGQLAWDKNAQLVGEGDIEKQTYQVFENIKNVLDEVGATWEDVVKLGAYTVKLEDINTVARIKSEFFGKTPPADTIVAVRGLAYPECLVEIDAIVMM